MSVDPHLKAMLIARPFGPEIGRGACGRKIAALWAGVAGQIETEIGAAMTQSAADEGHSAARPIYRRIDLRGGMPCEILRLLNAARNPKTSREVEGVLGGKCKKRRAYVRATISSMVAQGWVDRFAAIGGDLHRGNGKLYVISVRGRAGLAAYDATKGAA